MIKHLIGLFIFFMLTSCGRFRQTKFVASCDDLPRQVSKDWRKYKNPKTDFNFYCKGEFIDLLDSLFVYQSDCYSNFDKINIKKMFGTPHEFSSMKNDEIKFIYGTKLHEKEIFVYRYNFHYKDKFLTYDGVKRNHHGFIEFVFSTETDQFILYSRNRRLF